MKSFKSTLFAIFLTCSACNEMYADVGQYFNTQSIESDNDIETNICNVQNAKYLYDNTLVFNNEYQLIDDGNNQLPVKAIVKEKTMYNDKMILRIGFVDNSNTACNLSFDKDYMLLHYIENNIDSDIELKYIDSDDNLHLYTSEYKINNKNIKEIDLDFWDVDFGIKLSN